VGEFVLRLVGVVVTVSFAIGCGAGDERPPPAGDVAVVPSEDNVQPTLRTGPCDEEGKSVDCKVITGRVGDIVNCFVGKQQCTDGAWSACGE
jgi:hypothetical protein